MGTNNRFAVAVHALALLTRSQGEPVKSEVLAQSIGTNPVVVRRILGCLAKARLVASQSGSNGGTRLIRHPKDINLLEVYRSVEADNLFSLRLPEEADPHCDGVAHNMQDVLDEIMEQADAALSAVLAKLTLADVFLSVRQRLANNPNISAEAHGCEEEDPRHMIELPPGKALS